MIGRWLSLSIIRVASSGCSHGKGCVLGIRRDRNGRESEASVPWELNQKVA